MIIPAIRTESVFKASDNSCHSSVKGAKLHECGLALRRKLLDRGFADNDGKIKAIAVEMTAHYEVFAEIFDAVRRVRRA